MKKVRLHDKRVNEDKDFDCFEEVKCDLPKHPNDLAKRQVSIAKGHNVRIKSHFTGHA